MFCPKCGKSCGNENFCPQCGEKLKKSVDVTFCPKCGMNCGGAKFCSQCGEKLQMDVEETPQEEQKTWSVPLGVYKGFDSYIELGSDWLEIYNRKATDPCAVRILYKQLVALSYIRERFIFDSGAYLAVRWTENQHLALPKKNYEAYKESTTAFAFQPEDLLFYHICCFLYTLVDPASCSPPEYAHKKGRNKPVCPRDLQPYYEKYNPYRQDAVDALCEDIGIFPNEAEQLIDAYFDKQQQKEYAADPQAALRDLNKIAHTPKDEQREQLEAANIAFCPKCLSTSLTARKTGRPGRPLLKKIECICMQCGYAWEPRNK